MDSWVDLVLRRGWGLLRNVQILQHLSRVAIIILFVKGRPVLALGNPHRRCFHGIENPVLVVLGRRWLRESVAIIQLLVDFRYEHEDGCLQRLRIVLDVLGDPSTSVPFLLALN